MDSSGSEFTGGLASGGETSAEVSLVEESEGLDEGEGSQEGGRRERRTRSVRKKVVPGQERNRWRKAKGDGEIDVGEAVNVEKGGGVTIRGRCTLERVVSMNKGLTEYRREAVMATVLRLMLKYCTFEMERNLALALVKAWVPRKKAFRLGRRLVPFSVFDVALMTGLPAVGEEVDFKEDTATTEFGNLVRQRVKEAEQEELNRRKGRARTKDNRVYKNFIAAMVYLCEQNAREEQLQVWLKLYTWFVMSGVLFPRGVYVAAWELERYADDVQGLSRYAWAEAVWRYLVDAIEDMQRRLSSDVSQIQCNGFSLLLQVTLVNFDNVAHGNVVCSM